MKKNILIVGASRGIGAAVARFYDAKDDNIFSVSRTPSAIGEWIEADISKPEGIEKVITTVSTRRIDALLFMGGVWEQEAFSDGYDFRKSPFEETQFVINVNLIAPIEITKGLLNNLKQSENPRAIYMGSISGLELCPSPEVANSASKFGLRGSIQALRCGLKEEGIGFTVINPGLVATEEVIEDMNSGRTPTQNPIPLADVIQAVDWILGLSKFTEVGDVNLMQK
ncbi:SDR family oxidoreductase [Rubellicoccus peritrichatus]|uniref:SDR family oxidoreductase n=1 Tax=Rubellicoccus peritrichatus TaxID=3080537 RepID=A0AAQ3LD75_9BACT|nr:SDR family oxidoreductase [Puniceicoccus sp. CR14]WOO39874.1 SDR family oxidoreductase [Puniceicoccus sp. CR14]